jgi:hypothetical protein
MATGKNFEPRSRGPGVAAIVDSKADGMARSKEISEIHNGLETGSGLPSRQSVLCLRFVVTVSRPASL